MMARQAGIDSLEAEYFICMDCHMEVLPGEVSETQGKLCLLFYFYFTKLKGESDGAPHIYTVNHIELRDFRNHLK